MSDSDQSHPPESPKEAWDTIYERPEIHALLAAKARFIIPMCAFFLIYYFTLPLLVGLAPDLMAKKVWGTVNVAYVFALSQFFMTWIVAIIYAKVADKFDDRAHEIIKHLES